MSVSFEEAVALSGGEWLRSPGVLVQMLEGENVADAIAVIDFMTGRLLAFLGPEFPPEHRLASLDRNDVAELTAIFEEPPNQWFVPRVRGVVAGSVYAISHGWSTPRETRKLLDQMLAKPDSARQVLLTHPSLKRFLQMLLGGMSKIEAAHWFAEVPASFPVVRGRPPDETRSFFLEEVTRIAIDNGLEPRLPQHRDERETGVTPFFTLVLAVVDIVRGRVHGAEPLNEVVRRRLAPFRCSRIAWLDALERARETI